MKKIIKTDMLTRYIIKFIIRFVVFVLIAILYVTNKPLMYDLMMQPIRMGISPMHVLWFGFMVMMLGHIFPTEKITMAVRKADKKIYIQQENYSEKELFQYVQDQNVKAWKVMLIWLSFNAIFGALYLFGIMDNADLLMLTVFYFLCDYICILIFCPF